MRKMGSVRKNTPHFSCVNINLLYKNKHIIVAQATMMYYTYIVDYATI